MPCRATPNLDVVGSRHALVAKAVNCATKAPIDALALDLLRLAPLDPDRHGVARGRRDLHVLVARVVPKLQRTNGRELDLDHHLPLPPTILGVQEDLEEEAARPSVRCAPPPRLVQLERARLRRAERGVAHGWARARGGGASKRGGRAAPAARVPDERSWRVRSGPMADAASAAQPTTSLVLRAPDGEKAWTLIELQGLIESRTGGTLDGMEFAKLTNEVRAPTPLTIRAHIPVTRAAVRGAANSQGGVPRLTMHKNQLEGEMVELKNPLAIMTLQKPEDGSKEYHAIGIVRQKLVFKARPYPIARPQQCVVSPATSHGNKRARVGE